MKSANNRNRGQALVIVIAVLGLLFVIGIAIFVFSQAERAASLRHLDSLRARFAAEAAVVYAQKLLVLDRQQNEIDSFADITFTYTEGEDADSDNDGVNESKWFILADNEENVLERFSVLIVDEASKININHSSDPLRSLFSQLAINDSKAISIISSRPFNAVEETGPFLSQDEFDKTKRFLTVYSKEHEVDLQGNRRVYLNSASAQMILEAMQKAGIRNFHQLAANLKDASDGDLAQTFFDTFSLDTIYPFSLSVTGSWQRKTAFYEAPAGGSAGTFNWANLAVEDGEYVCAVYGPQISDTVGKVNGMLLQSGESLPERIEIKDGKISLDIEPADDTISRFSHIELLSPFAKSGLSRKIISGTEAIVINELMVDPSAELSGPGADIAPGENVTYTFSPVQPGNYYVIVFAKTPGGFVGDVTIHGQTAAGLYHGDFFTKVINSTGSITVEVRNNSFSSASFAGIKVSQQPDSEYIELLNVSGSQISLSGFIIEAYNQQGELIPGWPARVPANTIIQPYQHLTLTIDSSDSTPSPLKLRGNNISFQGTWGFSASNLVFEEYTETIDKTFDLLPDDGGRVILRDAGGNQIDAVEYSGSLIFGRVSLERGDPSAKTDSNGNGIFDGWYRSDSIDSATPSATNDNVGMFDSDEIKHNPVEIRVFNRPLGSLLEVYQLTRSRDWKTWDIADVSKITDLFAYDALQFLLDDHYVSGEFENVNGIFKSSFKTDTGIWEFDDIPAGNYLLSIRSQGLSAEGEHIFATYKTDTQDAFKNFSPLIFTHGIALYGIVEIAQEAESMQLKITNDTQNELALESIILEPVAYTAGRVNVNTAGKEVLRSTVGETMGALIEANRPLGNKDGRRLGIGDLFLLDNSFLNSHKNLCVKSDIYEIIARGESFRQGATQAFQLIHTVVERGE